MQADRATRGSPEDRDTAPEESGALSRLAVRMATFSEKWFPEAFIFALIALIVVAGSALAIGASPASVTREFGNGFWDLIPFTMQMAFVAIGGYVVATAPVARRLIVRIASIPTSGPRAVALITIVSTVSALFNWGFSLIFAGLLAREVARREELRVDYRAAGAAAFMGMGSVWALGISSSAAQLQANADSIPSNLMPITGVIPFRDTIFLWQSLLVAAVLIVVVVSVAYFSAPRGKQVRSAADLGVDLDSDEDEKLPPRSRPGEWLEYSPLLTVLVVALGVGWAIQTFAGEDPLVAISGLNTYNLLFLLLGMLLHWRPRSFLTAVAKGVPATSGVLIQFPIYAAIAAVLTRPTNGAGNSVADYVTQAFTSLSSAAPFPLVVAVYSAVLGFFIPSGGGKWLIEAPYVMDAANELEANLGWTVQVYNVAETLPNLINPFWMLPLLGILQLRARHVVGFTFLQLLFLAPVALTLLTVLSYSLGYAPPAIP
ncbi:short-chain fatty acid transporter [Streptomyces sp. AJS327]|uniref:short-chain fatty acid transporter n=1 Tax=Streptomyces sp. AJS327 TaxID=2545265 RepID=UPI0015DF5579|nr:TIGR00366 family protein [Streptomyces sp. AJS327]MBA0051228.1 short-chain fatty acid transporter [Streptomyces sp. AJS327]